MVILKKCSKCQKEKEANDKNFRKNAASRDGLKYYCIECDNLVQKKRYKKDKAGIKAAVKDWKEKNPEKVKGYKREWAKKNRDNK